MSVPGWGGYNDCYYVNDGQGNPGSLECGTDEEYDTYPIQNTLLEFH